MACVCVPRGSEWPLPAITKIRGGWQLDSAAVQAKVGDAGSRRGGGPGVSVTQGGCIVEELFSFLLIWWKSYPWLVRPGNVLASLTFSIPLWFWMTCLVACCYFIKAVDCALFWNRMTLSALLNSWSLFIPCCVCVHADTCVHIFTLWMCLLLSFYFLTFLNHRVWYSLTGSIPLVIIFQPRIGFFKKKFHIRLYCWDSHSACVLCISDLSVSFVC